MIFQTIRYSALLTFLVMSSSGFAQSLRVTVIDKNGEPLPQAVVSSAQAADDSGAPETAIMDQVDKLFDPFVLVVAPGTTVAFPNSDNIRHQVYSFSPTKTFELPLYSNQEAPNIEFSEPGIVVLGCNIHDGMRAYIYVSPFLHSQLTDERGTAVLDMTAASTEITVWYPGLSDNMTAQRRFSVAADQQQLDIQLNVLPQQQERTELSPLQQRFNRRKGND